MKMNFRKNGNINWIKASVIGVLCAVIISAGLTALLGNLVHNGSVGESAICYAIFMIRALSVTIGALVGTGLANEKLLPVIGAISGGYLVAMMAVGIAFFGGTFNEFGSGLISAVVGGVASGLIRLKPKKSGKRVLLRSR